MEVKVKFSDDEMGAIEDVYNLACKFTRVLPQYTLLEAVDYFFAALTNNTEEVTK